MLINKNHLESLKIILDEELIEIIIGLHCLFNDFAKVNAWLFTPNLNFGNIIPMELVLCGRSTKVLDFINDALAEEERKCDNVSN